MNYRYRATERFWRSFYALSSEQKKSARAAWNIFKNDPFDPRLRTHKIHRLSNCAQKTVHAVVVDRDLRALFYIEGDVVVSFAIGTHDIYKS